MITGSFPTTRLRRNRQSPWIRDMVAENHVRVEDLILPLFIRETHESAIISSLPGVLRYTLAELEGVCREAVALGIRAVALFPVTPHALKCEHGREALNAQNLMCQGIHQVRTCAPTLGIITDVALDPYTIHGHDGILKEDTVHNDTTLDVLKECALNQARAGAHVVAPSDMMDGRIGVIREHLDNNGFDHVQILSYAAKYASAFYGPFRDAVGSKGCIGDDGKQAYQMNPANGDEALRECAQDIAEGADMIMVKPGLPYLDIVWRITDRFKMPTFVYHVSGEYAMLRAAAEKGWVDYESTLMEVMISFKRAGATGIFTYGALDVARMLQRLPNGLKEPLHAA